MISCNILFSEYNPNKKEVDRIILDKWLHANASKAIDCRFFLKLSQASLFQKTCTAIQHNYDSLDDLRLATDFDIRRMQGVGKKLFPIAIAIRNLLRGQYDDRKSHMEAIG